MNFKKGLFLRELKNRFRGEAKIGDEHFFCHIPSSCKLSNLLNLNERHALFVDLKKPKKAIRYGLYAVQYLDSYIVLNSAMANKAVLNSINSSFFEFIDKKSNIISERTIEGYKVDIYFPEIKTIFEIKSIICEGNIAVFPKVYSERAIKQLKKLLFLKKKDFLFIILLFHLILLLKR